MRLTATLHEINELNYKEEISFIEDIVSIKIESKEFGIFQQENGGKIPIGKLKIIFFLRNISKERVYTVEGLQLSQCKLFIENFINILESYYRQHIKPDFYLKLTKSVLYLDYTITNYSDSDIVLNDKKSNEYDKKLFDMRGRINLIDKKFITQYDISK